MAWKCKSQCKNTRAILCLNSQGLHVPKIEAALGWQHSFHRFCLCLQNPAPEHRRGTCQILSRWQETTCGPHTEKQCSHLAVWCFETTDLIPKCPAWLCPKGELLLFATSSNYDLGGQRELTLFRPTISTPRRSCRIKVPTCGFRRPRCKGCRCSGPHRECPGFQ